MKEDGQQTFKDLSSSMAYNHGLLKANNYEQEVQGQRLCWFANYDISFHNFLNLIYISPEVILSPVFMTANKPKFFKTSCDSELVTLW